MPKKLTENEAILKLPHDIILLEKYKGAALNHIFKCRCGNTFESKFFNLTSGHTKSCGCAHIRLNIKGTNHISSTYFSRLKYRAMEKKYDFDLDIDYLDDLLVKQNFKCALSGFEIYSGYNSDKLEITASLDRIDSNKGYIKGNVQWVHKDVNNMKQDLDEDKFLQYCKSICSYRKVI